MKRRVFTRRRYEIASRTRLLHVLAWVGGPICTFLVLWPVADSGTPDLWAFALVGAALVFYTSLVVRIKELTGEWKFY